MWHKLGAIHKHASTSLQGALDRTRAQHAFDARVDADIVFEVSSAADLNTIDKSLQADPTMHTLEAWEARVSLRRSSPVRNALNEWWEVVLRTISPAFSPGEVPYLDHNHYIKIYKLLVRAMCNLQDEECVQLAPACTTYTRLHILTIVR